MQTLIVTLIVIGCTAYAAWALMPTAVRRTIASTLLKLPLPDAFAAKMRKAAVVSSGCGCDGCNHAPAKAAAKTQQVVTLHPRVKR